MSTHIYHERQLGALCGVHCVNNLLQGPRFGPGDLAEIAVRLDKKERRLLGKKCRSGGYTGDALGSCEETSSCNVDSSADGGNFSIQVLSITLARAGLKLVPRDHPEAQELMDGCSPRKVDAFVVQRRGHWYSLRALGPCWWDLDSMLRRPKPLDESALRNLLNRLTEGGHNVFLIIGNLPYPLPPHSASSNCMQEATKKDGTSWHEVSSLLVGSNSLSNVAHSDCCHSSQSLGDVPLSLDAYSESEVQAALFLTDQDQQRAAEVLQKARQSIENLDVTSPQLLARALSAAVGAVLQARRSMPAAIARLVALLCAPRSTALAAAAELVDCGELAHDLLTALAKKSRGWLWTDGIMQAATIAVDLLLALPVASIGNATARSVGETFEAPESGSDGEIAPLELPVMGVTVSTPSSRSRAKHSLEMAEAQTVNSTVDIDFTTLALDELMETMPSEGPPPGQPQTSAMGLKDVLQCNLVNIKDRSDKNTIEEKSRVRRRPSARRTNSQRLPP